MEASSPQIVWLSTLPRRFGIILEKILDRNRRPVGWGFKALAVLLIHCLLLPPFECFFMCAWSLFSSVKLCVLPNFAIISLKSFYEYDKFILNRVEHENSFITSGLGSLTGCIL